MLRPKKMKKVRLVVMKSAVERLIKDLHELGVVDISKTCHSTLEEARALPKFDTVSSLLVKLRGMLAVMEAYTNTKSSTPDTLLDTRQAEEEAKVLVSDERLKKLIERASRLQDELKELEMKITAVKKLNPYSHMDFSRLETRTLSYRVGEMPLVKIPNLKTKLELLDAENNLISKSGVNVILLLFNRKGEDQIDGLLTESGFAELQLPSGMKTPPETLMSLSGEIEGHKIEMSQIRKDVQAISHKNLQTVRKLIDSFEVEADRSSITSKFSSSKYLYLVEGWIADEDFPKLESTVSGYGGQASVQDVVITHHEMPPTVLDNKGPAKPFGYITRTFSLPNYRELDPTFMYFIALAFIYGMIVGDVLYGVISLLISAWIVKNFKSSDMMYNVGMIWLICSIPTMIFGMIFDEWGGMTLQHLVNYVSSWFGVELLASPLYSGFHRVENLPTLLLLTIFMSFVHLALGFILGAINEWHHNKKHAYAKLGWLGLELGIVMIFIAQLGYVDSVFNNAGMVMAGISFIIIAATEGLMGVIEMPGFVGNILSYTRIAVIGVVGVILAEIINEFLRPSPSMGLLALVMLPIFLALHAANCMIAMFEALVQGGRLNIVEFRSKFFHGGGVAFTPFAMKARRLNK